MRQKFTAAAVHPWQHYSMVCSRFISEEGTQNMGPALAGLASLLCTCRIVKQLQGSKCYMWLGGGEVDLKLGFDVADFTRAYKPLILDCTYDD